MGSFGGYFGRFTRANLTCPMDICSKIRRHHNDMLLLVPRRFKLKYLGATACFVASCLLILRYRIHASWDLSSRRQMFLKWPVINPFSYNYLINQDKECVNSKTDLLLVVPSAPNNFERRSHVRHSHIWEYASSHSNISLLFFIGKPVVDANGFIQQRIENESRIYNDIIQVNFFDLYKNIRLKAMSMLNWVITWCSETTYVIRIDDDVTVNLMDLIDVMQNVHKNYKDFIIGNKIVADVPARTTSKYYLSYAEYPHSTFPPYVLGGLIGYPVSTVQLLYQAALRLKPIWLDDVFITGMCAAQMGIPVMKDPKFIFEHLGKFKKNNNGTVKVRGRKGKLLRKRKRG